MTIDLRQTRYLHAEGRAFMRECITHAFERCGELAIRRVVLFTGTGEGALFALQELMSQPQYSQVELVAVTPPVGRPYKLDTNDPRSPIVGAGIAPNVRDFLNEAGVAVVSAHLPFKPLGGPDSPTPHATIVGEVLSILGGGFPLCVQATLMACDSGAVEVGERVMAVSADTALVLLATRTETFLSASMGLLVEEIVCRPAMFNISKAAHMYAKNMRTSQNVAPHALDVGASPVRDESQEAEGADAQTNDLRADKSPP